jgi:hypothetical protein
MYTDHVQTVFSLYTASLRPSIFPSKFVLMCIVLSYRIYLWTQCTIHFCTQLCTGHILADAGKREVKLLEDWNLKSFA